MKKILLPMTLSLLIPACIILPKDLPNSEKLNPVTTETVDISKFQLSVPVYQGPTMSFDYSSNITIQSGKDRVTIHGKTGKVTWSGATPDKAARAFWDAVVMAFPEFKKSLTKENP